VATLGQLAIPVLPLGRYHQHVDLQSDRSACDLPVSDIIHHLMHSGVVVLFVLGKHRAHGGELATEGLLAGVP
jgi:hypothetical protein